ncbi:E1 ubiquitin-activating protein [Binucleata daphniae]
MPIDENLYSRQLYVLGTDAMQAFSSSSVLILNLTGLGQEVAKNIILAGISKVVLYDPLPVCIQDLGTGFYFTTNDIGKRRDYAVLKKMKGLNPYVKVEVLQYNNNVRNSNDNVENNNNNNDKYEHDRNMNEFINTNESSINNSNCIYNDQCFIDYITTLSFTIIVTTGLSYKIQKKINALNSKFISCSCDGFFSQVFLDFKHNFMVNDDNGEPLLQGNVNDVDEMGVMTMIDGERHNLEDNKMIKIYNNNVNNDPDNTKSVGIHNIKVIDPFRIQLINYKEEPFLGGSFEEVKVKKMHEYLNLEECIEMTIREIKKKGIVNNGSNDKHDDNDSKDKYGGNDTKDNINNVIIDNEYVSLESMYLMQKKSYKDYNLSEFMLDLGDTKKSIILHKCYLIKDFEGNFCMNYEKVYKRKKEEDFYNSEEYLLVKTFSCMQNKEISPMVSVIGGFVAQEVLKGCSHKFTPLKQFMYFDSIECLNTDLNVEKVDKYDYLKTYIHDRMNNTSNYTANTGTRYDNYIEVFGKNNFDKLINSSIFIVGAGAIGCEHLKNMVMSGMGMNKQIYLTDMDSIEESNLNRQFLFRKNDVRKMKSEVAVREAMIMNEDYGKKRKIHEDNNNDGNDTLNNDNANNCGNSISNNDEANLPLIAYPLKLDINTEDIFSDSFYSNLTFVANALDNIEARNYVDNRIVLNTKPLFESGTLGTKGNTQVIIPYKTESYSSSQDPPEKSIPLCTLRNFPNIIEHCIEYALSEFKRNFEDDVTNVINYYSKAKTSNDIKKENNDTTKDGRKEEINNTNKSNDTNNVNDTYDGNSTFDGLVKLFSINASDYSYITHNPILTKNDLLSFSFSLFYNLFYVNIGKLLKVFPKDHITKEGLPFWVAPKRPPVLVKFDSNNEIHLLFVYSCCKILNYCYIQNDKCNVSNNDIVEYYERNKELMVQESNKKIVNTDPGIEMNEDGEIKKKSIGDNKLNDDSNALSTVSSFNVPLEYLKNIKVTTFEKDDDTNSHVDFIYACANIRAENYNINRGTKLQVKGIAGKIIPAIATTTALISGLSVLEMYKYCFGCKFESFRNSYVALGLPTITSSEPFEPIKNEYYFESDETQTDKKNSKFTLWDRFEYDDMTLRCFLNMVLERHKVNVEMITINNKIIYCRFYGDKKYEKVMDKKFSELHAVKKGMKYIVLDVLYDNECEYFPYTVIKV